MAFTVQSIMTGIMNNPDVLAIGIAVGFVLKWFLGRRNRRGMGGMGGGGLFG